jgi:general secretion pathway protein G
MKVMTYFLKRERGIPRGDFLAVAGNGERASAWPGELARAIQHVFEARNANCRQAACSPFPVPRSPRGNRASGFTLLEMLAVIVLIGIIGTVVVTQVGKNVDKGKYGAGKAQLTTLSQKIENYALDNGTPPAQLQDLLVKPANAPNWQGPYAKESELKDPWRHAFGYQYPGQHGSFDLIFYGQDGKPGGDGYSKDVGNWQ